MATESNPMPVVAWMTEDGRTVTDEQRQGMFESVKKSFCITLVRQDEAERERERLEFLMNDGLYVAHMHTGGNEYRYRVECPLTGDYYKGWHATPREAIDAAMAATAQGKGESDV